VLHAMPSTVIEPAVWVCRLNGQGGAICFSTGKMTTKSENDRAVDIFRLHIMFREEQFAIDKMVHNRFLESNLRAMTGSSYTPGHYPCNRPLAEAAGRNPVFFCNNSDFAF